MGKKRNLNGLPNNLIQQYFSTLFYWKSGYMPDWIWHLAIEKSVYELEINITNQTVFPNNLEVQALIAQLPRLQETINKTLISNGFEESFIANASIKIKIYKDNNRLKQLSGQGMMTDIEGNSYTGKLITEQAYKKALRYFSQNN